MSYQVAKLIARIAENLPEMSQNVMQGWIQNPKALQKALRSVLVPSGAPIVVDYDRPLDDIIEKCSFDHVEKGINDINFPPKKEGSGKKPLFFRIYRFSGKSDWIIEQMRKNGHRPATLRELLAFGKKNPQLQRKFPIIALGSAEKVNQHLRVSALDGGALRELVLFLYNSDWASGDFLGVCDMA